jgi:hypothetical protein
MGLKTTAVCAILGAFSFFLVKEQLFLGYLLLSSQSQSGKIAFRLRSLAE